MIPHGDPLLCRGCGLYLVRQGETCPHCATVRAAPAPLPPAGRYGYADPNRTPGHAAQ